MTNVKVGRQNHEGFIAEMWQKCFSFGVTLVSNLSISGLGVGQGTLMWLSAYR